MNIYSILFKKVDNSPIILFRIFFGGLMAIEALGAILTSWVKDTVVDPSFSFTFIGFEFLLPLLGQFMYWHFILMGCLGLMIAFGWYYRINSVLFALFWSVSYFIQKTNYNNHYYLIFLISWIMTIVPAHQFCSLDVKQNRVKEQHDISYWVILIFIIQVAFVYFYASLAKLYPDWLNGKFVSIIMNHSSDWFKNHLKIDWIIQLFKNHRFHLFIAYSGIVFDLLILPAILWKKTRKWAFIFAIFFHLFNSATLHIGIFPYFALSLSVFCFDRKTIQQRFFKNKTFIEDYNIQKFSSKQKSLAVLLSIYMIIQLLLPIRHYFIKGDVLWTEEGHRLSWRMMLRSRAGETVFYIKQSKISELERVDLKKYLHKDQISDFQSKPDMIWQFAQFLKNEYQNKGIPSIQVFVESKVSINGGPYLNFIDSSVDLAQVKWRYFGHQDWILEQP